MLLTVADFRRRVESDIESLVVDLQTLTTRSGQEEREAWMASLPKLSDALSSQPLSQFHLYLPGTGYLALEYQLPAAASWCDVVLLGRKGDVPSVLIVELKHWKTRGDLPGPVEGLMVRAGQLVSHPSDQVRGYSEYCQRFHSAVHEHKAEVRGCVLFTNDRFIGRYAEAPNDSLAKAYPCFSMAPEVVGERWPSYLLDRLTTPDESFAANFVKGRYRQDRGFVSQIGQKVMDPASSPFVLLDHQRRAFGIIRARLEEKVLHGGHPRKQVIVVEGPPGSGKSVLAAHIWASLVRDDRVPSGDVVLTTTSTAQTSNWTRLFQVAGDQQAAGGVVKRAGGYVPISTQAVGKLRSRHGKDFASDPVAWRSNVKLLRDWGVPFRDGAADEQYLVSVVDEAHALINPEHSEGRGQFGFAPSLGPLAWHVIRCSTVSIFLLDSEQGFRDRENTRVQDIFKWGAELGAESEEVISLSGAQFRCAGSVEYIDWVEGLLAGRPADDLEKLAQVWRNRFSFRLCDSPASLETALQQHVNQRRSARLLASYARRWKTKAAANPHGLPSESRDFHESYLDEGKPGYWSKVWNFIPQGGTDYTWFIQAPQGSPMHDNPLCEVGCPYAVRGFDFDYVGVLWLGDLVWRSGRWVADHKHAHDTGLTGSIRAARAEQVYGSAHERLRGALAQAYRILLTRGIIGCLLWVEDSETRKHLQECLGNINTRNL